MQEDTTIWVGLDVHKSTITACWISADGETEEDRTFAPDPKYIRKLFKKLSEQGEIRACYEAGPCGYEVKRQLDEIGIHCDVIAPSLIPRKPGDKIKTDRRDARKLARLYRSGDLTSIRVPNTEEESLRDLVRVREQIRQDKVRQQHRLLKFLLRHGRTWAQSCNWTDKHWRWINQQKFENNVAQVTFEAYVSVLQFTLERLRSLDETITREGEERIPEAVGHLRCLRGFNTLTAVGVLAELFDVRRFRSPRELMSFVGLVPGQHSSAGKGRPQGITKTGNRHVRRLLVEAAWHYIYRPNISPSLRKRSEGQPEAIRAIALKAQHRLYQRYMDLTRRGKKAPVAIVALARELVGFIWAILTKQHEHPIDLPAIVSKVKARRARISKKATAAAEKSASEPQRHRKQESTTAVRASGNHSADPVDPSFVPSASLSLPLRMGEERQRRRRDEGLAPHPVRARAKIKRCGLRPRLNSI